MTELTLKQKIAVIKKTRARLKCFEKKSYPAYLCWALNKVMFKGKDDIPASYDAIEALFPELNKSIQKALKIAGSCSIAGPMNYSIRYKLLDKLQAQLEKKLK